MFLYLYTFVTYCRFYSELRSYIWLNIGDAYANLDARFCV